MSAIPVREGRLDWASEQAYRDEQGDYRLDDYEDGDEQ